MPSMWSMLSTTSTGPVHLPGPCGHLLHVDAPAGDEFFPPWIPALPKGHVPVPEEVLIIQAQFLKTGTGNIR